MKTEITKKQFRELSHLDGSSMERRVCLDDCILCRIFLAGKQIAESVTKWVNGFRCTYYFSFK